MKLELEQATIQQSFRIFFDEKVVGGEITNVNGCVMNNRGEFEYSSDGCYVNLTSEKLRAIADKLDKLNEDC